MASVAVCSGAVVLLFLKHCLLLLLLFVGLCVWSLFCYAVLSALFCFVIISAEEERAGCFSLIEYLQSCGY